ncbi:spore germination protein [Desulfotomaculum nigrificans]|uniref:spore germination protein n=1 Tax=Desulfotomaculum nigrificans TaxID=1565 RepID=UPI0001FADF7E|nr:spore germination protein [Desulfotomaculum nigrificans]
MSRLLKRLTKRLGRGNSSKHKSKAPEQTTVVYEAISANLSNNLEQMKQLLGVSPDIKFREFKLAGEMHAFMVYVEELVNIAIIENNILKTLMFQAQATGDPGRRLINLNLLNKIKQSALTVGEVKEARTFSQAVEAVLSGDTAIFIEGEDTAIIAGTKQWKSRALEEPVVESVVRGPRIGFNENLMTNVMLLRRAIKSPDLQFEMRILGKYTKTNVCIVYIKSIVNPKVLAEVKKRLERVRTDDVGGASYIHEVIEDSPYSLFPTVAFTERPDTVSAKLIEGRVAILVDGTPFVMTVPTIFVEFFQSAEDYYTKYLTSSLVRWIRLLAFFITLFLPVLYVAVETFHQEMLPTSLLISMFAAKEGVPFPTFVEILIMGITFEILREAGVRMPRPVGQAVSIVGALVLGDAAVSAGLASTSAVIVTGMTAIAGFVVPIPEIIGGLMFLRLFLLVLAASFGLFGVMLGTIVILIELAAMNSFGVPYLAPFAPGNLSDLKDTLVRAPWWAMGSRPGFIGGRKMSRQGAGLKPSPSANEEKELVHNEE